MTSYTLIKRLVSAAQTVVLLALHANACAQTLHISDPAPSLTISRWIKGDPVAKFDKGRIYVIEFWATWSEPCKLSAVRLTDLQKRYPQIVFIGISTSENDESRVAPFVKAMGDNMGYRVAADGIAVGRVAPGRIDVGPAWSHWMRASGKYEIPTAFIVDQEGRISWIGHPLDIDEPLSTIADGKWNLKAAAARAAREHAIEFEVYRLNTRLLPLMRSSKFKEALNKLNQAVSGDHDLEGDKRVYFTKLTLQAELGNYLDVAALADRLAMGVLKSDIQGLNELARNLLMLKTRQRGEQSLVSAAIAAAQRADRLAKGMDPNIADTLAAAYFAAGNKNEAIYTEGRAIAHCTDLTMRAELMKQYEEYRK